MNKGHHHVANNTATTSHHHNSSSAMQSSHSDKSKCRRKLLVLRHGERIDFTFNKGNETWMSQAFDSNGKYSRFNINMPKSVPHRRDGVENFHLDTPLTEMGYLQAKITGRALKDAGVKPNYIYVSPALRCVQTCVGILKGMNSANTKFQIEPGLFEWGGWFRGPKQPGWLKPDEFQPMGYSVNVSYKPIYTGLNTNETLEDYYTRSFNTVTKVLSNHPEDCTIMLVAHGASLDTCTRQLCGREPRNQHDFYSILHATPYLACAQAVESPSAHVSAVSQWNVTAPPIHPFQHQANASYNWHQIAAT